MKPHSLRMRLLLGAACAIFAALAAAWFAMTLLFQRHIERQVEQELTRDAVQLVAVLQLAGDGSPQVTAQPSDPRFDTPSSGLYWQLSTPSGTLRSRSLWDQVLPLASAAQPQSWSLRTVNGPFEQQLLLLERRVRPDAGGADVLVQVGYDRAELRTARRQFGLELGMFLALLWLILSAAAWLQVQLGLRPLQGVRREVQALQRNPHMRLAAASVAEIEPLSRAINELADARGRDLERARRRAADLAHGLKTPLAALAAQSRRARESGAIDAADGLDRAIAAASAAVESELSRSRAAAARTRPSSGELEPAELLESLIGVVERTDFGARLVFEADTPPKLRIGLAAEDFVELMGALIENAARHAHRRVRVRGSDDGHAVTLSVEDDGPGIDIQRREQALIRGARLDEVGPGHGLGLAIVHELVEATGGALSLDRSELGGLKVEIKWVNATAPSA